MECCAGIGGQTEYTILECNFGVAGSESGLNILLCDVVRKVEDVESAIIELVLLQLFEVGRTSRVREVSQCLVWRRERQTQVEPLELQLLQRLPQSCLRHLLLVGGGVDEAHWNAALLELASSRFREK